MAEESDDAYRDAPRTLGGTAKLDQPDEVKARVAQKRVTFSGGFNPETHTVGGRTAKLDKPREVLEREAAASGQTVPRRLAFAVALFVALLAAAAIVAAVIR